MAFTTWWYNPFMKTKALVFLSLVFILGGIATAEDIDPPFNQWVKAPQTDDFGDSLETFMWGYVATSKDVKLQYGQVIIDCGVYVDLECVGFLPFQDLSSGDLVEVTWTPYQLLLKKRSRNVLEIDIDEDLWVDLSGLGICNDDPIYTEILEFFAKSKSVKGSSRTLTTTATASTCRMRT